MELPYYLKFKELFFRENPVGLFFWFSFVLFIMCILIHFWLVAIITGFVVLIYFLFIGKVIREMI